MFFDVLKQGVTPQSKITVVPGTADGLINNSTLHKEGLIVLCTGITNGCKTG